MNYQDTITRAFHRRESLFGIEGTDCFRLFNMEGDGLGGLAIDRYGAYLLMQFFDPGLEDRAKDILRGLEASLPGLPFGVRGILLKDRTMAGDDASKLCQSRLLAGDPPPGELAVRQCGIIAAVDLMRGQNTGLFLDMREVREFLAGAYPGDGSLLNLFSYTALFSVHALVCGMKQALNIDLSRHVLQRARRNYELNGLRIDGRDFIFGDSMDWIKRLRSRGGSFSFIVVDPPTFSRNRKRTFTVKKHMPLMLESLKSLARGGLVLSSVNSHGIGYREYLSFHPRDWTLEAYFNEPMDFVRSGEPYLKAGVWRAGR